MPRVQDRVDLEFTEEGDFALDGFGDLADTGSDPLMSFRQEVLWRIKSKINDWRLHPDIGSGIDDLKGEPNIPSTAQRGVSLITSALSFDNFIRSSDISVRPVPVDIDKLAFFITINVVSTPENKNEEGVEKFQILFDVNDEGLVFV